MGKEQLWFYEIFGSGTRFRDLPPGNEIKVLAEAASSLLREEVEFLATSERFPNQRINELAFLLGALMNEKIVRLVLANVFTEVAFWAEGQEEEEVAFILAPLDFSLYHYRSRVDWLSDLVCVASFAKDFCCGKHVEGIAGVKERAAAYAAEFLLTMQKVEPDLQPDDHQREILAQYPQGLDSLPAGLRYETGPLVVPKK